MAVGNFELVICWLSLQFMGKLSVTEVWLAGRYKKGNPLLWQRTDITLLYVADTDLFCTIGDLILLKHLSEIMFSL